ncbi:hypothetical protein HHA04nite_20050 [Halomonas halophila]|uniref:Uncharacterized protein n=1 Tax=Halomonas halophila TaxID=29573 RepID=A0ABQ0U5M0_9GAMM|nr:hypothetical protein HHA04nite_20050 [Halomonas halophila]
MAAEAPVAAAGGSLRAGRLGAGLVIHDPSIENEAMTETSSRGLSDVHRGITARPEIVQRFIHKPNAVTARLRRDATLTFNS